MKNKIFEKINVDKLNEVFKLSGKVLKVLYLLLMIGFLYILTLVVKEWSLIPILLTILKIMSPFFIGFVIAWLLNPFCCKLTDRGVPRGVSVILVFGLLVIFLYLFLLTLIPVLGQQINDIVSAIPGILTDVKVHIDSFFERLSDTSLLDLNSIKNEIYLTVETFAKNLTTSLPTVVMNFVSGLFSGLGTILIGFVIGFYLLFNFNNVTDHLLNLLPRKGRKEGAYIINEVSIVMHKFVNGTLLISLILFIVSIIGFSIIGLNAPVLFAFFCAITNLIPYIGPYIGGAPAVLVGLSQSPLIGILVLIFIVIVQGLESTFLHPIVIGKKMDLHPVTIVISLLIFGYFFGIIGMIVATPIVAILKIIYIFLDTKYDFFGYTKNKSVKKEISKIENTI